MVQVAFGGPLKGAAGAEYEFEVEAANIRELLTRLAEEHPHLKPILDRGVAVAIDGEIYRDAWFQPIPPDSEVFILPPIAGG